MSFRAGAETRERLQAIVAAESECCAFLTMELRETADAVQLTLSAPEGAETMLAELVGAFGGQEQPA